MPKVSMGYAKKIKKIKKKNIAKLRKQTPLSTACTTISQPNNTRRQVSSHKVRQQQRAKPKWSKEQAVAAALPVPLVVTASRRPSPHPASSGIWHGATEICYKFVLRKTWHPKFYFFKMLKLKVPRWFILPTKTIWHVLQIQNLSHTLLVIMLSFVKLFVTLIEILVMHP